MGYGRAECAKDHRSMAPKLTTTPRTQNDSSDFYQCRPYSATKVNHDSMSLKCPHMFGYEDIFAKDMV